MIKAVIFDLDDTLIKTSEAKYEALKYAAKKFYGLEITTEQIRTHWGKPFKLFMKDLYGNVDEIERILSNYQSIRNQFPSPAYEHAVSIISHLSELYVVGLVTASMRRMTEGDLSVAGFNLDSFHFIQTAEQTTVHKPDPAVFKPILTFLLKKNITAAEIVYVGDSPQDAKAAQGSGLHFIALIDRTHSKEKFLKDIHTITHLSELPNLLKSIQ